MDSKFTFENILFAKVEPIGHFGEMNLYLFFKDGRQPFYYEGYDWKGKLAQEFVVAFEHWGATRVSSGIYDSTAGFKLVGHGWTPSLESELLRKFVREAKATIAGGEERKNHG